MNKNQDSHKCLAVTSASSAAGYCFEGRVLCVGVLMTGIPDAMAVFIVDNPQWDQYRLMQPAVVEHYLDGLFRGPNQGLGEPEALSR